jgi:2-dehydropantoate 2-reductase
MRILMVGAGATGGYYGGRLALAGRDVTFLVRGRREEQLRTRGLEIVSRQGDATLENPKLISAEALKSERPFDLVILSTKAYSLDAALDDVAPAIGPETLLLPILNGMRHIDVLCQRFGREHVMPGSVRIVSDMDAEGRVIQMTDLDSFTFGELEGGRSARAEALLPVLSAFGFKTTLSDNVIAALWNKWWILATMGAVCIVSGGTVGETAAVPYGAETAEAILRESVSIAAANGFPVDETTLAPHIRRMTEPGSSLTSSMYRDMTKGYPVEADHILGDLLARAKGVPVPLLKGAYVRLKVYEASRTR